MRTQGYEGPITVVNGEPHSPYNRTLVNKAVLSGLLTPQRIAQHVKNTYGQVHGVVYAAMRAITEEVVRSTWCTTTPRVDSQLN